MRKYAIWGTATSPSHRDWVAAIGREFESDGFERVDDHAEADFVLNMFDADSPKAFRRSARGTYSASFYELEDVPDDVLRTSYPNLVRTLANVVVLHVPGEGVWFTTMERGTYKISDDPAEVFERLAPLAKSKLVIDNEFVSDLEPELWDGDEITADISAAGKRMQELDLLPAPFPVHEYPERARSAPRDAPLPGRRALLRESVRPQGRDSVLDERERRRQVSARGSRPRHPARHGL